MMLKPCTRLCLQIQDLLNASDNTENTAQQGMAVKLIEMAHGEDEERFVERQQKEYDGIGVKGGMKVVNHDILLDDASCFGNRLEYCIKESDTPEKTLWI